MQTKAKTDTSVDLRLDIVNPIDYPGWEDLLLSCDGYTFFHTSAWARVLIDTYGYKPVYFSSMLNGTLRNIIPLMEINSFWTGRRGVSLPFSDCCELMICEGQDISSLVEGLIEYGQKAGWKYLELRDLGSSAPDWPVFSYYYGHILDLSDDPGKLFDSLKRTVRQNISKAQKKGLQISVCNSMESINEFYHLNCLTRKRHGLPPQPYRFFKNIYKHIISEKLGVVLLAGYHERSVAGGVFFHFADKAIYKYNASDSTYQSLRPNDLILWKAIEWYCRNGFKKLSLGRTQVGHEGLRRFKTNWCAKERIIKYYRYSFAQSRFVEGSEATKSNSVLFRNMPIPLLRLIGTVLYKHMG